MIAGRFQRKRLKGWRKPEGSVIVDRTSKWGNPYLVSDAEDAGIEDPHQFSVDAFRSWLEGDEWARPVDGDYERSKALRTKMLSEMHELRGKHLVCFCPLDKPCHADVLIEMANESYISFFERTLQKIARESGMPLEMFATEFKRD